MTRKRGVWLIIVLLVVLVGLALVWLFPKLRADNTVSARAAVQDLYEAAKEGQASLPSLAKLDRERGTVLMFQIDRVETGLLGRPVDVWLKVTRQRGRTKEHCHLPDGHTPESVTLAAK